jgi:hypothetical protein
MKKRQTIEQLHRAWRADRRGLWPKECVKTISRKKLMAIQKKLLAASVSLPAYIVVRFSGRRVIRFRPYEPYEIGKGLKYEDYTVRLSPKKKAGKQ